MDTRHLRFLRLTDRLVGFYDGRSAGQKFADYDNWVDDGAISLGVCSYALVDGGEALVYDTHVSEAHAAQIRRTVEALGAKKITVVLSHWHLDHIAGNAVFADCEIIANRKTCAVMLEKKAAIENGRLWGPPAIPKVVLPNRFFAGHLSIRCGGMEVELHQFDIHSNDATVLRVPDEGLLLAGDTLEDTVTYVAEPESLSRHVTELDRLSEIEFTRILPNHGDPVTIENGGYRKTLIRATQQYVRTLLRARHDAELRRMPLRELVVGPLKAGWINYFPPYEAVHRQNLQRLLALAEAP